MTRAFSPLDQTAPRSRLCGLLVGAALVLGGCASGPDRSAGMVTDGGQAQHSRDSRGMALDGELARRLGQDEGQAEIALAESPWGSNVRVTAEPAYFAASGRQCRRLHIRARATEMQKTAVACASDDGWTAHRAVTRILRDRSEP